MGLVSTLSTCAPYHLLAYSILFGSTTYQSFFSGIIAFRALPYAEFSRLQHKIFPAYFKSQVVATALLFATNPVALDCTTKTTLGIALVGSLLNAAILGPKSGTLSAKRLEQIEKEGKSHKDPSASDEMKAINKSFAKLHGISVLTNLFVWGSLLTYGVALTEKFVAL